MIISINQPAYLPWLGYFERVAKSDVHVVLDNVQFEKNSFTNRNKIKTPNGSAWLTVPVKTKGKFGDLSINEIEIDNATDWRKKHWKSIDLNYAKAPYYNAEREFFRNIFERNWENLNELLKQTTAHLFTSLDIKTKILHNTDLKIAGYKDDLVLNICRELNASKYISGALGKNYLDLSKFEKAGIEVEFQNYIHPEYSQLFGKFESFMSVIDLVFNNGNKSKSILLSNSNA